MKSLGIMRLLFSAIVLIIFIGCGGGSSSGTSSSSTGIITDNPSSTGSFTLRADAGEDKSVSVNETITLIGKGTTNRGVITNYEWSKDGTVLATTASFEYTPSAVGTDTLKLTVIVDGDGDSASDTVVITVNKVIEGNQPPVANAGADKSVTVNQSITLTGSGTDSDGSITSYEWKKDNTVLASTASFSYTPSVVGRDTLTLTVTDDEGSKISDSVVIHVTQQSSGEKPLIITKVGLRGIFDFSEKGGKVSLGTENGFDYNYNVDWGDGTVENGLTGSSEHSYKENGSGENLNIYTIKITGEFPAFKFVQNNITSIEQWGSIKWKSMKEAFSECSSLQINATDIPNFSDVNDTSSMFYRSQCFPSSMSQWDMSNVKSMESMFQHTNSNESYSEPAFNQDISSWDTSSVINMKSMFNDSYYDGDFSKWDVSKVTNMEDMFSDAKLSSQNYDKLLNAWSKLELQPNVIFGSNQSSSQNNERYSSSSNKIGTQYTGNAREARDLLQRKFKWTIEDGGIDVYNLGDFKPFIGAWETRSYLNQITIPTSDGNEFYQYNVDWGDGTTDTNVTTKKTHNYANEGNYTITISGNYPQYKYNSIGKLLDVQQWGDNEWKTMEEFFYRAPKATISATDAPNLLSVTNMSSMFSETIFNSPIGHWDVSTITQMYELFGDTEEFNQDISSWNVSSVTNMSYMFYRTTSFNQDISSWDVSNVTDMRYLFAAAISFNQDLESWNVSKVENMNHMFGSARSFNQDIGSWNISNVTSMFDIFNNAQSFNQDLSSWNFSKVGDIRINGSNISTENYSKLLLSLLEQNIDNRTLYAGSIKYNKEAEYNVPHCKDH